MLLRSLVLMIVGLCLGVSTGTAADKDTPGARVIKFFGYDDCIELTNKNTRVVLCPAAGGRVLVYSLDGKNSLFLDESEKSFHYAPGKSAPMSAGRFDIGPESIIPRHPLLWYGRWTGEVTDPRTARLTSMKDNATGVQLVREFTLDAKSTHLACRQTIRNISKQTHEWCHWSRTFALGNGIVVIPLSKRSRFPNHYVMYRPEGPINLAPKDDNIRTRDGFLEITDVPKYPKLGMDSKVGWFAYLMKNDIAFVKRYATYPNRVYNEVAGLTISIWYPADRRVELEPIGPREHLKPGESSSFTEHWWLLPYEYPAKNAQADLKKLSRLVETQTTAAKAD